MKYNPNLHNRHSIRLHNWNYATTGAYFITICCQNREYLFGDIVNDKMILNEYGEIAKNEWLNTAKIRKNIKLYEFVIMPNHIHGILENVDLNNMPDENIFEKGKNICKKGVFNTPLPNTLQSPSNTIGAIIRGYKSSVTKQINDHCRGVLHTPNNLNTPNNMNTSNNRNAPNKSIWQRNYYEHIIRNETEYAKIAEYICNNPILWQKGVFNTPLHMQLCSQSCENISEQS